MKTSTLLCCLVAFSFFSGLPETRALAASKPNIILIYSDDHGYADLGVQGSVQDIRTPNLDALAKDGVRFKRGYVSAPQCVPSRAGVITGRYQQRFGVEDNLKGPLPLSEITIAERLKPAGYVSCQIGKWHLEAPPARKLARKGAGESAEAAKPGQSFQPWEQGFDEYYTGPLNTFAASHDLQGNKLPDAPKQLTDKRFRCVWQADAAVSFIDRHQRDPFFMYLAFFAPHVPLESPEPWFSKTPADAPLQRRQALAMIAAMDDGIGRIRAKLKEKGIEKDTMIFFIGDNGAPLKEGAWDGSLNLPLIGEKGMLTDGGIRTPFVAAWPGKIPAGQVFEDPVINLDVAATANAIAGLPDDKMLDGVDLLPYLMGDKKSKPHDTLYWRWRSQAAVREDHWKYIMLGKEERYLFDLNTPEGETKNLLKEHPEIASALDKKLMEWNAQLPPPGLPRDVVTEDQLFYDAHVKKTGTAAVKQPRKGSPEARQPWVVRNASSEIKEGALHLVPDAKQKTFVSFSALNVRGPATLTASLRSVKGGPVGVAWRSQGQEDFVAGQSVSQNLPGSSDFQEVTIKVPDEGAIIHVRLLLPPGVIDLKRVQITGRGGKAATPYVFETPAKP